MAYFGVLAGLAIGGLVLWGWYKLHRDISQGGNSRPVSQKPRSGAGPNALEQFIAAYQRGEVSAGPELTAPSQAAAPYVASAAASRRDPFLTPAEKQAYDLCKTALKDHHVFAHVALATLSANGISDQALAPGSVDLVVCNPAMTVVAAIDVVGPEGRAADASRNDHLRALGVRHLRLHASSLPKPEELQALLYRT
jgi:hypothetical protein